MVASDGGVFCFGDARFRELRGGLAAQSPDRRDGRHRRPGQALLVRGRRRRDLHLRRRALHGQRGEPPARRKHRHNMAAVPDSRVTRSTGTIAQSLAASPAANGVAPRPAPRSLHRTLTTSARRSRPGPRRPKSRGVRSQGRRLPDRYGTAVAGPPLRCALGSSTTFRHGVLLSIERSRTYRVALVDADGRTSGGVASSPPSISACPLQGLVEVNAQYDASAARRKENAIRRRCHRSLW